MVVAVMEPRTNRVSGVRAALLLVLSSLMFSATNAHAVQVVKPQAPPAPASPPVRPTPMPGGTIIPAPPGAPAPTAPPAPLVPPPTLARPPAPRVVVPEVKVVADAPTPEALWTKYIEASGGRDAFPTTGSRRVTSKLFVPASGIEGRMETRLRAPPERMTVIVNLPGIGDTKYGFDGTHGWTDTPALGPRLAEEEELSTFRRDAAFDGMIGHLARAKGSRTLGEATFRGHDTWVVELEGSFGSNANYYFDKSDGLLRGVHLTTVTRKGTNRVEMEFVEHATFGKAKLPSKSIYRSLMQEIVTTVEDVSTDEIAESEFEPTPAIKALIEKKTSDAATGSTPAPAGGSGGTVPPAEGAKPAGDPKPAP